MIGKTVSHYEIRSKLGAGGMGVVYKAYDTTLKRYVALKFLPPDLTRDDDARKRFIHEAQAAAALDHPNICTVYEIGQSDGNTFIVMPLVDGQSMREKIKSGPLPLAEALDLTTQVARGLSKAHQSGIIHRDIKPANILLTSDGNARIADFGLAKLSGQTKLTRTGMTVGTLAYMSPEQARGAAVDGRSDVYSLGAVLYEALTGKPPFEGEHEAAVMYSIMNVAPEPLSTHRDDLPANLQRVMDRALAKDREERYESADALIADLDAVQSGGYVAPPPGPGIRVPLAWIVAALVVTAAFIGGYIIQSMRPDGGRTPAEGISADVVAVFPFSYQGGPDYAYLESAIVELLGDRFNGAGGLRVIPTADVDDPGDYADAAADAGAGMYLTGSVVEAGGVLNVTASLFETGSPQPDHQASGEGSDDQIREIMDKVAADLLADYFSRPNERTTRVARETTGSFEAFKWYLVGEDLFRRGHCTEAVEAFERAVTLDSTYAMAYYRMGWAAEFTWAEFYKNEAAFRQALRYRSGLPERERLLVEGKHARRVEKDDDKAKRLFGEVIRRYPDDVEANLCYGETLGFGVDAGGDVEVARSMLEKVLSFVPDHFCAITEMVMISEEYPEVDPDDGMKWYRRRLEVSPDGDYFAYDTFHMVYGAGADSLEVGLMDMMTHQNDGIIQWCGELAAVIYGEYEVAEEFIALLTLPSRPEKTRARGHIRLAYLDAMRGRWSDAQEDIAVALPLDSAETIELSAELCLAPLMPASRQQLVDLRRDMANLTRFYEGVSVPFHKYVTAYQSYVTGMLSARLDNIAAAERYAAVLDTIQPNAEWQQLYSKDLSRCIRAEVALVGGDTATAIAQLARTRPEVINIPYSDNSPYRGRMQLDLMRAIYVQETGSSEDAITAYHEIKGWIWGLAYLPAKQLKLGELYESTGDTEKAAEAYREFVELWKNCDPELRPLLADVQSRLSRITQ